MHVVIIGVDPGAVTVGPFESFDVANAWALSRFRRRGATWFVEQVHPPHIWDLLDDDPLPTRVSPRPHANA